MKLITNFKAAKQNIVIVSHSCDETITRFVIHNKTKLDTNIQIVLLQELLTDYEIFDVLDDSGTLINWRKGKALPLSNESHLLLNRVLSVPNSLFNQFIKEDQSYAQREFEAYLGFSFNAFQGVGNQSASGICVDNLSLPQQWNKMKNTFQLPVPNYYWGPIHKNSLASKDNLIYSQTYNFLNWATSKEARPQKHFFCFERPQGTPVFILSIGSKQLITSDKALPTEIEEQLKKIAGKISNFFNHFISEILIFVNGSDFTFGCINPEIVRSNKNKNLDHFIFTHLLSEFYQCIN